MNEDLSTKYRPSNFSEVLGQDSVIESLKTLIEKDGKLPSCLLFTGPSGCGKTTLARICAKSVGCIDQSIMEVDAATNNGIDQMREVTNWLPYTPFGSAKSKVVILDECHRLSKQAWDSILKSIEEPPAGSSWILCSTDPQKIPVTIKTRSHVYELRKVELGKIKDRLVSVVEKEDLKTDKKVINLIAIKSEGSLRQALVYLSMVRNMSFEKAQELIRTIGPVDGNPSIIELCRLLVGRCGWNSAIEALKQIEEEPETIRLGVVNYFAKCVLGARNETDLRYFLDILFAFSGFFNPSEKLAPVLIALAKVLLD